MPTQSTTIRYVAMVKRGGLAGWVSDASMIQRLPIFIFAIFCGIAGFNTYGSLERYQLP